MNALHVARCKLHAPLGWDRATEHRENQQTSSRLVEHFVHFTFLIFVSLDSTLLKTGRPIVETQVQWDQNGKSPEIVCFHVLCHNRER